MDDGCAAGRRIDFYGFVMNRCEGIVRFPELTAGPWLLQVTQSGAGSAR
jgi:hypothetical protein